MKYTFWPYRVDTYDLFRLVLEEPRIPKNAISGRFKVKNPKTGELWWNKAVEKRIIIPPVFRRNSYLNFREHFYFLNVRDPHKLYEALQYTSEDIIYFSVQTGFANFQIISKKPIDPKGDTILEGERSDYFVSIPPKGTFESSLLNIEKKLVNLDPSVNCTSPLVYHDSVFEKWDEMSERIYENLCNDLRKPFAQVLKSAHTYSDKVMKWIRSRDEFGQTITMYFPLGEGAYQLSLYAVETVYDSLLINLFSLLPSSSIFYRLGSTVMMCVYLPFTFEGRYIVRKVLSLLQEKELVKGYTNSVVEYGYRT